MDLPKRSRLVPATTRLFEPTDPEWAQLQGAMAENDAQRTATAKAIFLVLFTGKLPNY